MAKTVPMETLYERWYHAGMTDAMRHVVLSLAWEGFPADDISQMLALTLDDVLDFISEMAEEGL